MQLHHLAYFARDVARTAAFYRDVLGLEPLASPREGAAWFVLGDALLMIEAEDPDRPEGRATGVGGVLALRIDAAERADWERRLTDAGVAIERRSTYSLYVLDPDGRTVGLSSYPRALDG